MEFQEVAPWNKVPSSCFIPLSSYLEHRDGDWSSSRILNHDDARDNRLELAGAWITNNFFKSLFQLYILSNKPLKI